IEVVPDGRVLAFALAISFLSALLFGLAPAIQLLRGGRVRLNQEQAVASFASGKVLVVLEVALSLVLVSGAAGFTRSFQNLRAVPTGFSADHVSVVRLARNIEEEAPTAPVREAAALVDSLRGIAGLQSASLSNSLLFNDAYTQIAMRVVDQPKFY